MASSTAWVVRATLRPGREVTVLDIGAGGVLIATPVAVRPGKRVELQLVRDGQRHEVTGKVVRCQLMSLTPLGYQAAVTLDADLPADAAR